MRTAARLAGLLAVLGCGAPAAANALADCVALSDPARRLACYDAVAGRPDTPAADPVPAPVAVPAPAADFGRPPPPPPPQVITALEARVVGTVRGWSRGTRFTLDNGQVWKATGDESAFYPELPANPRVVIRKGRLGAFWMELEGAARRVKVQRVD